MDTESIKPFVSLLAWGGLLFVMMRYGCGAHMMGGHGHHGGGEGKSSGDPTKDPVCGMEIDPPRAAAASVHEGTTYYFCSGSCRDKFEREPQKYVPASELEHGAHHHG